MNCQSTILLNKTTSSNSKDNITLITGYVNETYSEATNYYINCYSTITESNDTIKTEVYPY